jgi:hypothetical protein
MEAKLVNFCTYSSAIQAEVVKLALAAEGIESFVGDANIVSAEWLAGAAFGGVKLKIAEADVPAAMALLKAKPSLANPSAARQTDGVPRCLSCDAPMPEEADACPACGWSYLDGAEPEPAEGEEI